MFDTPLTKNIDSLAAFSGSALRAPVDALKELFPSQTTIKNGRFDELMRYFEKVNQARNHPGFTFLYHYEDYKLQAKEPYSYT